MELWKSLGIHHYICLLILIFTSSLILFPSIYILGNFFCFSSCTILLKTLMTCTFQHWEIHCATVFLVTILCKFAWSYSFAIWGHSKLLNTEQMFVNLQLPDIPVWKDKKKMLPVISTVKYICDMHKTKILIIWQQYSMVHLTFRHVYNIDLQFNIISLNYFQT